MKNEGGTAILAAAAGASFVLAVLCTLLAVGYQRQKALQRSAGEESMRAAQLAQEAMDAANLGTRARDQAEDLAGFLLEDLQEELEQLGRTDLLAAAAAKVDAYFEGLPAVLHTPETRSKRAAALTTLAQARYAQGDLEEAVQTIEQAITLRRDLAAGPDPKGEQRYILARELEELALFRNQGGDPEAARRTTMEAMSLFASPPEDADKDGRWQFGMASAHFSLGEVDRLQRRYQEALVAYEQAGTHLDQALQRDPDHVNWVKKRMNLRNNSGVARMHLGQFKEAEAQYRLALEDSRRLVQLEPKNRRWQKELGTALMNLGTCLDEQKRFELAEPLIREGLEVRKGLVAWDPTNTRARLSLAHSWHNLSSLQFETGRSAEAWGSAREAMAVYRRLLSIDPAQKRWIKDMQQAVGKYRDRLGEAEMREEALRLLEETAAFAEETRRGAPQEEAWNDFVTALQEDIRSLGGTVETRTSIESRRERLEGVQSP